VHQIQDVKGKVSSGDSEGQEVKSGLALSRRGLDMSSEKAFLLIHLSNPAM